MPHPEELLLAIACTLLLGACRDARTASPPRLTAATTTFTPGPLVYLDDALVVTFAAPVDAATVGEQSVQLQAIAGPGAGVAARGAWHVAENRLLFVPDLPLHEPVMTSGGLQPDTEYALHILGGDAVDAVCATDGQRLDASLHYRIRTRAGFAARHVFAHNLPGGPQLVAVTPWPASGEIWQLGSSGGPAELRLDFDQPLDPSEANLPRTPSRAARGPIVLTYDDPVYGPDTWVAADVELQRNATTGATVVLRPRGVLPSAANLRIRIGGELRDLIGEERGTRGPILAATVATENAYEPQFDAVLVDIARGSQLATADFPEVPAIVAHGALRVPDAFPALTGVGDWSASSAYVILRTDEQVLHYDNGQSRTFTGGVLHMKNLHIEAGQVVRGAGPNPLVLVVDGDARIDGTLTVRGADAERIMLGQYRGPGDIIQPLSGPFGWFPPGPVGPAGGAAGGRGGSSGTYFATGLSAPGSPAAGTQHAGGQGGTLACPPTPWASGGGGGAGAVAGDPWFPSVALGNQFVQRAGHGGRGGVGASGAITRTLTGAVPGVPAFTNASAIDDHWGRAYVPYERREVLGELLTATGGSGGGSGGNLSWYPCGQAPEYSSFTGGNGGGGGGAVIVQVRGTLTIGPTGAIDASGGDGTGGPNWTPYWPDLVGGGGGGGGGMVVLMAGRSIVLHAHGETFANQDYDFVLSADGGVCKTSSLAPPVILGKYPANGQPTVSGSTYDQIPLGGFGGLGVIQLMVPVGRDNLDGTNTVLDDAITIVRNGVPLQGIEKQRFLGWRGFPDSEQGVWVDDFGLPTNTAGGQGDMRPAPILMPAPFTTDGRARARSGWLPLGAVHRRSVTAPDGLPRAVVGEALQFGSAARSDGWLPFGTGPLASNAAPALLEQPATVVATGTDATAFHRLVHVLELGSSLSPPDRYVGCVAELQAVNGSQMRWLRVVGNRGTRLFLEPDAALPTGVDRVQLRAWFAELPTPPPDSYLGADLRSVPRANVRFGFAFHRAPEEAATAGFDANRFPTDVTAFLHDLTDPATSLALRAFGPTHLQWDVLLDGQFRRTPADAPPPADAQSQIAVRRFWLPLRY